MILTKKQEAEVIHSLMIHELSENFDRAIELSGRAINNRIPCFVGSEIHLSQIAMLFDKYAGKLLTLQKKKV